MVKSRFRVRVIHLLDVKLLMHLHLAAHDPACTHTHTHSALWTLMPRGEVECVTLRSTSVYNKPFWKLSMEEIPQLLHSSLAPPRGAGDGVAAGGGHGDVADREVEAEG